MSSQRIPLDEEEFWDDLLAYIERHRVIPVVGAELLTITVGEETVPLYRAVAERLLSRYGLAADALPGGALREHHPLNDAVAALAATGFRVKDLYRPIYNIIQELVSTQSEPPEALRQLAAIRHFNLFATTTPDGLLVRALDEVRGPRDPAIDQIEYAPSLPTDRRGDIPEVRPSNYRAVFYMFGKADVYPFYAIHDEDLLEFAYTLQYTIHDDVPPVRMFSELRGRNLLLIGCNFADWLSRFVLRLSNEKRLSSDERPKKEFLVDLALAEDGNLTVFLERFSRDSRCYPVPAQQFVAELHRRWNERHPPPPPPPPPPAETRDPAPTVGRAAHAGGGSIFISYASEDFDAARRLFEDVQGAGAEVVWLDKRALKPGDEWRRHIEDAVRDCDLFLPLISATTEQRTDGFFRLEWGEAAERSRRIQGRKFIFPVVIDPDYDGQMNRYRLVPPAFRDFQYGHAPAGKMSPELEDEITQQLRDLRERRSRENPPPDHG